MQQSRKTVAISYTSNNHLLCLHVIFILSMYSVQIHRKMVEIMVNQASTCDVKELVSKFIP
jgi:ribosomal protein S3AE